MIGKDGNISSSGYFVHGILQKLLTAPAEKQSLRRGISDDNLTLYINSLRNNFCKIIKPNQNCKKYRLTEGMPFINIDREDLDFLTDIKEAISEKGNYHDIYNFNRILLSLRPFVTKNTFENVMKIVNSFPFGFKEHIFIEEIEYCIRNKITLKMLYRSPNTGNLVYIINPLFIVLESHKLYLWCISPYDEKIKYLRVDRITGLQRIKKRGKRTIKFKKVLCEAQTGNFDFDEKFKIIASNGKTCIFEFDFVNEFHLIQKISAFNVNCRILRPRAMAEKYKKILGDIINEYKKEL